MKFSVCIPNYNYAQYIGETIESVLAQNADFEIHVADNCSTDDSVSVVRSIDDPRISISENRWNVGFASNLDRACKNATGERMLLLSSDDLAEPDALAAYRELTCALGDKAGRAVFASAQNVIDGDSRKTGRSGFEERLWQDATEVPALSERLGARVLYVPADKLLRRALLELRTPFAFATTCYPKALYDKVEGYLGGFMFNPDKMFAWKLLAVAEEAYFIDKPLFSYRVHDSNQASLQRQSGALKHLMDQYRATFDTPPQVLQRAGLSAHELAVAFIEHDIALRGLKMVAEGNRHLARRGVDFGMAAYPDHMRRSRKITALRGLLALGPGGTALARRLYARALKRFRGGEDNIGAGPA